MIVSGYKKKKNVINIKNNIRNNKICLFKRQIFNPRGSRNLNYQDGGSDFEIVTKWKIGSMEWAKRGRPDMGCRLIGSGQARGTDDPPPIQFIPVSHQNSTKILDGLWKYKIGKISFDILVQICVLSFESRHLFLVFKFSYHYISQVNSKIELNICQAITVSIIIIKWLLIKFKIQNIL